MQQFAAVLLSLVFLPFCIHKKLNIGASLLIIGAVVGLMGGLDVSSLLDCGIRVFTTPSSLSTLAVIVQIGILCGLLRHYGFLTKIEDALKVIINSQKIIIMVLPAIMGIMQVPGGAAISAPFANSIGADLSMTLERRSVVNVIFRHVSMFVLPFASSIILTGAILPQIDIYALIGLNAGFMLCFYLLAYLVFVHPANAPRLPTYTLTQKLKATGRLLYYISPIYMVILLNNAVGVPLYLAVFLCIIYVGAISGGRSFVKSIIANFNVKTLIMLVGVYFFQNIVTGFKDMMVVFSSIFQSSPQFVVLLVIACLAIVFGAATGLNLVALGIILPIVASLHLPAKLLLPYAFFVYVWSVLGYFYSPLHLCQLLTNECIGCSFGSSFKEHMRLIPIVVPIPFLFFYLYTFLLR